MEALDLTLLFKGKYRLARSRDVHVGIQHAVELAGYWLTVSEHVDERTLTAKRLMPVLSALRVETHVQFMGAGVRVLMRELTVEYKAHKRRATQHVR
jgi:hypothetical protein